MEGHPIIELAEGLEGREGCTVGVSSHNLDVGLRQPVMTGLPLRVMIADLLVKVAVHPLSHNCPIDMREPEAREGKTWTSLAAGGKFGSLSFAWCVA